MKNLLFLLLLLPALVHAQSKILLMQNKSLDPGEKVEALGLNYLADDPFIWGKLYIWSDTTTKKPDDRYVVRSTGACSTCAFLMIENEVDTIITASHYYTTTRDIGRRLTMINPNSRTVHLMRTDSVNSNHPLWIVDGAGTALTNPIIISSPDSINKAVADTIKSNGGMTGYAKSGYKYRIN